MVTIAPAIAAPETSATEPTIALVVSPCPHREIAPAARSATRHKLGMPKVYTLGDVSYTFFNDREIHGSSRRLPQGNPGIERTLRGTSEQQRPGGASRRAGG